MLTFVPSSEPIRVYPEGSRPRRVRNLLRRSQDFMRPGATFSVSERELRSAGLSLQSYLELIGARWLTRHHTDTREYFLTYSR